MQSNEMIVSVFYQHIMIQEFKTRFHQTIKVWKNLKNKFDFAETFADCHLFCCLWKIMNEQPHADETVYTVFELRIKKEMRIYNNNKKLKSEERK